MKNIQDFSNDLTAAVAAGDLEKVKTLMRSPPDGFDINACSPPYTKQVTLRQDMKIGNQKYKKGDVVDNDSQYSLSNGGQVQSLLMVALTNGRADVFKYLVEDCNAAIVKSVSGSDYRFDGQRLPFSHDEKGGVESLGATKLDWETGVIGRDAPNQEAAEDIKKRMVGVNDILSYLNKKTNDSQKNEIVLVNLAAFYFNQELFHALMQNPSLNHNPKLHRGDMLRAMAVGYVRPELKFAVDAILENMTNLDDNAVSSLVGIFQSGLPQKSMILISKVLIDRFGEKMISDNIFTPMVSLLSGDKNDEIISGVQVAASIVIPRLAKEHPAEMKAMLESSKSPLNTMITGDSDNKKLFYDLVNKGFKRSGYEVKQDGTVGEIGRFQQFGAIVVGLVSDFTQAMSDFAGLVAESIGWQKPPARQQVAQAEEAGKSQQQQQQISVRATQPDKSQMLDVQKADVSHGTLVPPKTPSDAAKELSENTEWRQQVNSSGRGKAR